MSLINTGKLEILPNSILGAHLKDVRVVFVEIWNHPMNAREILDEALDRNQQVFEFEKVLSD